MSICQHFCYSEGGKGLDGGQFGCQKKHPNRTAKTLNDQAPSHPGLQSGIKCFSYLAEMKVDRHMELFDKTKLLKVP